MRPDNVVPEIFVDDGPRALAFYCDAFGATERSRMMTPDGRKLVHGEILTPAQESANAKGFFAETGRKG